MLYQTLKTAIRHGWLQYLPDLSEPYKTGGKIEHRAWFSPEEYKKLYEATRRRVQNPRRKRYAWQYAQVHDYVLFMANTGLRPDEAGRLEYRDVTIVDDAATGETILEIEVRGKRGVGYCKSTNGAVITFERLKKRNNQNPTDLIFPKSHHAKNCRTSVEMIEKYYASHIKTSLDAAAINERKPKPIAKKREASKKKGRED